MTDVLTPLNTLPWLQLGTELDHDRELTALDAMKQGSLTEWNLRKSPIYTREQGKTIEVPGRSAVLRDNPETGKVDVLGDVGENYTIIQNEDHARFLDTLLDESGATFDMAGTMNDGKIVFLTLTLPGGMLLGGADQVVNQIAVVNSHDGSYSFTVLAVPFRFTCANMLNMAFKNNSYMFRVRHTSSADKVLHARAADLMDHVYDYLQALKDESDVLLNTKLTQARFEEIIAKEFGAPKDASTAAITRSQNKIDEMERLFADATTQDGIRDTAWAGLMALTEWFDHYSPTRGDDRENARAQKAILDPSFKNRARRLIMAEV